MKELELKIYNEAGKETKLEEWQLIQIKDQMRDNFKDYIDEINKHQAHVRIDMLSSVNYRFELMGFDIESTSKTPLSQSRNTLT